MVLVPVICSAQVVNTNSRTVSNSVKENLLSDRKTGFPSNVGGLKMEGRTEESGQACPRFLKNWRRVKAVARITTNS